MSRRPEFTHAATADYLAAVRWYESDRVGRGRAFEHAVEAALDRISNQPNAYRVLTESGFRRVMIRRFPCALFYRMEADRTIVHAVFHTARNPSALRARLGDA